MTTAAADEAMRQQLKAQAEKLHARVPVIKGVVKVAVKSRDGSGSGTMEMPYAKVGNAYKLT